MLNYILKIMAACLENLPCRFGLHTGKWNAPTKESWARWLAGSKVPGSDQTRLTQSRTCSLCGLVQKRYIEN